MGKNHVEYVNHISTSLNIAFSSTIASPKSLHQGQLPSINRKLLLSFPEPSYEVSFMIT